MTAEQMVFVPLTRQDAAALRAGSGPGEVAGHAATAALRRSHDYDDSMAEDADYAALAYAGVRAVLVPGPADPLRLVLAAAVHRDQVEADADDPYGQVVVRGLRWRAVQALFADEPEAAPAVATARQAAAGSSLADALDLAAVEALDDHDLLWFAPEELDHLPATTQGPSGSARPEHARPDHRRAVDPPSPAPL